MKCDPNCIYFPQTEVVTKEWVEDGVKYRKVIRRCGYDTFPIKTWEICHRADGPIANT